MLDIFHGDAVLKVFVVQVVLRFASSSNFNSLESITIKCKQKAAFK